MDSRSILKSMVLVVGVFAVLLLLGTLNTSTPSSATIEADRQPTTTTTTEPPPEGVSVVLIDNGVFRPANLKVDLNEDPREYVLVDSDGNFGVTLAEGDTFEFDYSTLESGIHRYNALIGSQRIPGSVDSRPDQ